MTQPRNPLVPVGIAYAAFVLVGISAGVGGVLLPAQISDYGVDKATIGVTFFATSAGFMLAGATTGQLLHRVGIRIALSIGGATYLVAALYLATRPPFAAFVAAQVLAGYGTGMLESVLNVYLTGLDKATVRLNRLHAFFGVGALVGPLLAAGLLRFLSWPAVWLALALAAAPLLIGFLVAYPRSQTRSQTEGVRGGLLGGALRSPGVLLGSAFLAVYVGLEIGVGTWAYSFLVEVHGLGGLVAGYLVSGYWLGLTLGRFLISPLAARIALSPASTSFACLGGVAAAAALAWVAPAGGTAGAVVAGAALVLLGFFLGPLFPTAMAVAPQLTAARLVPTAIGVMNAGSVVGGAVFPWLAGAVAQEVGLWTLLPFALVLAVVQVALWRLMVNRMSPAADAASPQTGTETTSPQTATETTSPQTGTETTSPQTSTETTSPQTATETTSPQTGTETASPLPGLEIAGPPRRQHPGHEGGARGSGEGCGR